MVIATNEYGRGKIVRGKLSIPSWRQTLLYAAQSIRLRLGRCLITTASVAGTIAFLSYNGLMLATVKAESAQSAGASLPETAEHGDDFFVGLEVFSCEKNAIEKRMFVMALSMLVAFVGITNSMLMSIKERHREIATFKCLGAVNAYVRRMFLLEAMIQGGMGSIMGIVLGVTLHLAANEAWAGATAALEVAAACLALGLFMTALAAAWPIRAALAMMPIEALRVEE